MQSIESELCPLYPTSQKFFRLEELAREIQFAKEYSNMLYRHEKVRIFQLLFHGHQRNIGRDDQTAKLSKGECELQIRFCSPANRNYRPDDRDRSAK
jgi:hypothetical protein